MMHEKKGKEKHGLFLLVLVLLFVFVFAYVVFAVQEISTVTLNSTLGTNLTSENLINCLCFSIKFFSEIYLQLEKRFQFHCCFEYANGWWNLSREQH